MQCPNCINQTLVTTQRRDIDIDHCPNCGGVWLDKGELEKIIALASDEGRSSRDWDEGERDDGYGRSRSASDNKDDDEQYEGREHRGEGRYEDDDDDSGSYDDRAPRPDSGRGEPYQGREREPYGRGEEPRERPSIWREIFENLEKLPLPRV
jgi:Zn-finger nucleic acid-binding protein